MANFFRPFTQHSVTGGATISQEQFALDAGVDRSYVGRLERRQENPTVEVLERLATALGAKAADLFIAPAKNERPPGPWRAGGEKGDDRLRCGAEPATGRLKRV